MICRVWCERRLRRRHVDSVTRLEHSGDLSSVNSKNKRAVFHVTHKNARRRLD